MISTGMRGAFITRMANKIQSFRDLLAWQKAMDLVEFVYRMTADFPSSEQFGLTAQMRKAVCRFHPISRKAHAIVSRVT